MIAQREEEPSAIWRGHPDCDGAVGSGFSLGDRRCYPAHARLVLVFKLELVPGRAALRHFRHRPRAGYRRRGAYLKRRTSTAPRIAPAPSLIRSDLGARL